MSSAIPLLPPHLMFDAQARGLVLLVGLQAGPPSLDLESIEVSLHGRGIATLNVKLLPKVPSDVPPATALLVAHLSSLLHELAARPGMGALPLGLCCGRQEAAAVLAVAARHAAQVKAVVLLGGEVEVPDETLAALQAPVLMIVGPGEFDLLGVNRRLCDRLGLQARLEVLPEEGHLFADSGLGMRKAELAAGWFARHLPVGASARAPMPPLVPQMAPGHHLAQALAPRHSEADGSV